MATTAAIGTYYWQRARVGLPHPLVRHTFSTRRVTTQESELGRRSQSPYSHALAVSKQLPRGQSSVRLSTMADLCCTLVVRPFLAVAKADSSNLGFGLEFGLVFGLGFGLELRHSQDWSHGLSPGSFLVSVSVLVSGLSLGFGHRFG